MTKTEDAFRHWVGLEWPVLQRGKHVREAEVMAPSRPLRPQQPSGGSLSKRQIWRMLIYVDCGHDEEDADREGKEDDHHQDDVD